MLRFIIQFSWTVPEPAETCPHTRNSEPETRYDGNLKGRGDLARLTASNDAADTRNESHWEATSSVCYTDHVTSDRNFTKFPIGKHNLLLTFQTFQNAITVILFLVFFFLEEAQKMQLRKKRAQKIDFLRAERRHRKGNVRCLKPKTCQSVQSTHEPVPCNE
jgi:hypothetical protein